MDPFFNLPHKGGAEGNPPGVGNPLGQPGSHPAQLWQEVSHHYPYIGSKSFHTYLVPELPLKSIKGGGAPPHSTHHTQSLSLSLSLLIVILSLWS